MLKYRRIFTILTINSEASQSKGPYMFLDSQKVVSQAAAKQWFSKYKIAMLIHDRSAEKYIVQPSKWLTKQQFLHPDISARIKFQLFFSNIISDMNLSHSILKDSARNINLMAIHTDIGMQPLQAL